MTVATAAGLFCHLRQLTIKRISSRKIQQCIKKSGYSHRILATKHQSCTEPTSCTFFRQLLRRYIGVLPPRALVFYLPDSIFCSESLYRILDTYGTPKITSAWLRQFILTPVTEDMFCNDAGFCANIHRDTSTVVFAQHNSAISQIALPLSSLDQDEIWVPLRPAVN